MKSPSLYFQCYLCGLRTDLPAVHLNDAAGTGPGAALARQGVSPVDGHSDAASPPGLGAGVSPLWHSLVIAGPAQYSLLVLIRHLRYEI